MGWMPHQHVRKLMAELSQLLRKVTFVTHILSLPLRRALLFRVERAFAHKVVASAVVALDDLARRLGAQQLLLARLAVARVSVARRQALRRSLSEALVGDGRYLLI